MWLHVSVPVKMTDKHSRYCCWISEDKTTDTWKLLIVSTDRTFSKQDGLKEWHILSTYCLTVDGEGTFITCLIVYILPKGFSYNCVHTKSFSNNCVHTT